MGRQYTRSGVAQSLDLQSIGAELYTYGEIDDDTYRHINPSLAWHDDQLYISIRSCNFMVERHGAWSFRDGSAYSKTDVLLGKVNPDTLQVYDVKKLELSKDSPTRILVSGLEDVRLFSRKDGLHAIGFESDRLTRSLHNQSASMAEYLIDGKELKYIRTLKKPDKDAVEKNWSPTDTPTKEFDFTYSPTQSYKDDELIGKPYTGIIHGGSQLLKQKDGTYISVVHDKVAEVNNHRIYDRFVYRTYLARHDKQGLITQITKPFRFGTLENIEFAGGMVEYDGYFLISLGIRDCKYAIAKIKTKKLTNLLEPFTP